MGYVGRSWYARWKVTIFSFEWKRDRDYFVAHQDGAEIISAKDAYDNDNWKHQIKVNASCAVGSNKQRKERIKNWHGNK